ncbi:trehalase family glycosidase [Solimonas sp. K1W22B-7]|uniref:trehalase family glycosidase n=1 Tax=Solimonas sp. K1W22B-7 TaxID=2303331 RepID=UPI0013C4A66C|nr:trehalase family glycosidase [Solimonas sp. K1W22B-7]
MSTDVAHAFEWSVSDDGVLGAADRAEIHARSDWARGLLNRVRHPSVPPVTELHLPLAQPVVSQGRSDPSPGLASPLIEEARNLRLHDDFKSLSDLHRCDQDAAWTARWQAEFDALAVVVPERRLGARRELLQRYLASAYEAEDHFEGLDSPLVHPQWTLDHPDTRVRAAFDHIEAHWCKLVKTSAGARGSSLLRTPYPFLIPAGRFREAYYWDTAFGIDGLIATGRLELARMQADNFLELIRRFGFVPNGNRDYYLSRSQPPLSSRLIRAVVEASDNENQQRGDAKRAATLLAWVRERALPLLASEFLDFWSNPETRYDTATGLHHHWDALEAKRPERYSEDEEADLGKTLRDVRAMTEAGLDFTILYAGPSGKNEMSGFAPVMLNALLVQFAGDVAWLAGFAGDEALQARFSGLAGERRASIDRYLWDDEGCCYRSLHLETRRRSSGIGFTVFAPLFAGIASARQAERVLQAAQPLLRRGGIAGSSRLDSLHQWDGDNGWAPAQVMAVRGLQRYGFDAAARDIAQRWVEALSTVFERHGGFFERINVETLDLPLRKGHQYPVQEGFLWTNSSFVWMATEVLGHPLIPIAGPSTPPSGPPSVAAS